jgi:protein-disulfide isomerase
MAFSRKNASQTMETKTSDDTGLLTPPVSATRDHVRGPADAPLTLVEYGDYACAFCTESYPVVEALREELGEQLRFAYRHFAVTSPSRSRPAAEAAEAAAAQDAFWPMHDALSRAPGAQLSRKRLHELAAEVGLDADPFHHDLEERVFAERIREDYESARDSGVDGTPAFFVGRQRYTAGMEPDRLLDGLCLDDPERRAAARVDLERLAGILDRAGLF